MALSLDDKLLGEKMHYYCSSSEDEDDDPDNESKEQKPAGSSCIQEAQCMEPPEINGYSGHCTNTGPKGVLQDWRRYKQLETEKRQEHEQEKAEIINKLSFTCRSHLDDEREKAKDDKFLDQFDKELEELEDEFLKEYRKRRIEEMRRAFENVPQFGTVVSLTKASFLEALDKENPNVTVIVHVYAEDVAGCTAMNGCLKCLAQEYPNVKFCKIRASEAKLSLSFASNGVPALLVYKKGELIGNFIRMSDDLGDDFFATEVEGFLVEHGMLPDRTLSTAMRNLRATEDSDSDFDVD